MDESITVLHVDDEPGFAEVTATALERQNDRFVVDIAASAEEAMDRLCHGVDCVVSDYEMQGTNGLELLEAVRRDYPELPFILFTGKGSEEVASEAISTGVTDYLQKETGADQFAVLANRVHNAVEKYRIEREAERTRARLQRQRDLLEAAPDAMFVADVETGEILETNQAATQLLDKPREEIIGMHQTELHPPEKAEEYATLFRKHVSEGGGRDDELEENVTLSVVDDSGERIPVEISANLVETDDGTVVQGFFRDISDRKERQRELQRERDRVSALFENMATPIVYYEFEDGDPYARDINEAFEETFGVTGPQARGRILDDIVVPAQHREEGEEINEQVLDGEIVDTEVVRATTDGPRTFNLLSVPLQPGESGEQGFAVYTDISNSKERERELRRQNKRLEQLTSFVGHDLRHPLTVLEMSLELAQETGTDEHFQRCYRTIDRMHQLIDDLLTLARQGEAVDDPAPVALRDVLGACWATVETGNAELSVETGVSVVADESRLKQLFENLIRNAVEHGGESVTITVGELSDRDGFYVEDDGRGIQVAEPDRVFEAGFSTEGEDAGFGLAIVAGIVEAHGWTIDATGSDDGGARFEISGVDLPGE